MNIRKTTLSLCIALGCAAALADETAHIEHILVSADFSGQHLQTLPASVSVISQQQISERQAQTLDQILATAPNVNVNAGASRGRFFQIRGIGERSQFAEPINPSVGFFVDDVDLSGIAGAATLFDVEQVEVLKGPQATEFGANALAGAIKIKTAEADANQVNHIEFGLAEQNTWRAGIAAGTAVTDTLFLRVATQRYKSDGFMHNIYLNRDDTNNLDEWTSRLKIKYLASEALTLDINYQYFDIDNGYDAFSLDNDRRTRSDDPGFDRQQTHALSLKTEWQLDWGSVKLIAAASDSELAYGYDEDWTYVDFHPWTYSSFDAYYRDRDTQSLEIRAQSNATSRWFHGKTDWILGLYARQTDEQLLRQYTYADGDFSSDYQPRNQALYLNTFTQVSKDMRLTFGLRLDNMDIRYRDNSGFTEALSDTIVGGKLVLDHHVHEQAMVYIGVSRGYKASGFNPDERISQDKRLFSPEYSWNYEAGVKGSILDGRGSVRLALFFMERKDTQISDFDLLIRPDGTADFVDVIDNADNGTNYGLELESQWQLTPEVSVFANLGWLRATFKGYENAKGEWIAKRDQAQSPRYMANLGLDWALGTDWHWHLEADAKDAHFFSDGHNERSDAYVLLHSRLSYQLADWSLSIWGRNLLDEEYQVRGFGGFNNDPREFYATPKPYYQLGDGRQWGISAQYSF